jgi:hypothetical protein
MTSERTIRKAWLLLGQRSHIRLKDAGETLTLAPPKDSGRGGYLRFRLVLSTWEQIDGEAKGSGYFAAARWLGVDLGDAAKALEDALT